ncbi:DUF2538 family protein [Paenibacillus sp. GCM10027627]|uniref:DUF2538 family protein n=1 Tax=unclassified Paenibacillus TaxID=185978 RepID=UPI00363EA80A
MDFTNTNRTNKDRANQPKEYGMTLGNVWFSSQEHGENFVKLLGKFKATRNQEYAAACYIVSHPEIFGRIDWNKTTGPVEWYWGEWVGEDDNDPNGYHEESEIVSELSSAYRSLARAAVELFTGSNHHFGLMQLIGNAGDEVYKIFVQSLEIRRDRFVIEV